MNRYHFPASEVLKRYQKIGSMWYLTSLNGAIFVRLMGTGKVELGAFSHGT